MLLSEIVFNIKNLIAGGIESDDENLSNYQVAFMVAYYRAKLLKQDQDKGRLDKSLYIQNLGKVELIQADKNECCDIDACILRTKEKLPKPLETYMGLNLTFVGTLQGRPFNRYHHNTVFWKRAAKYTGKEPAWYYQNGYIYIIDPPTAMFDTINIQGIFERPENAEKFVTCGCVEGSDCSDHFTTMDFEYPIPLHHIDTITKLFADTELRILKSTPPDTQNDGINQLADLLMRNAGNN